VVNGAILWPENEEKKRNTQDTIAKRREKNSLPGYATQIERAATLWFFRNADDAKLKRNEEGDKDPRSKPPLCLSLRSFSSCIIGLAEEPHYATGPIVAHHVTSNNLWR